MRQEDCIVLELNSGQSLAVMNLINLRLQMLAEATHILSTQEQIEYQALRSVALQMRNGAEEKVR